jgi:galactokinase
MYRIVHGATRGLADTAAFLDLLNELENLFATDRTVVVSRAPGRLDLMGGIADYSGSLVLELPIASAAHVALQLHDERTIDFISLSSTGEGPRRFAMPLDEFTQSGTPVDYRTARARFSGDVENHWAAYVAGAFLVLMRERGIEFDKGARVLIRSEVPEGKGVSSSAALEVATMQAIAAGYSIDIAPRDVAILCQLVENHVAGAPCGVMDQMTSSCGDADRLLALVCQPSELRGMVELPNELEVWGLDSGIRHSVGGADYGKVRAAAFMGYRMVAALAGLSPRGPAVDGYVEIDDAKWGGYLANITPEEFESSYAPSLPERISGAEFLERYGGITDTVTKVSADRTYPVLHATRHPVHEHDRVSKFANILATWSGLGRAGELGELMYQSHASYSACGLGSPGTDAIVDLVRGAGPEAGLYGAKITGGGSGGTVAILGRRGAGDAVEAVRRAYAERAQVDPLVITGSSPGAGAFGHLELVKES